jgi:origin recognition complex subunit 1
MPGTGKTESINHTLKKLNHEKEIEVIPDFNYIYLNGMKMKSANDIYTQLYKAIFNQTKDLSFQKSCQLLEEFFLDRDSFEESTLNFNNNSHIIIVIDEIDMLVNKKQTHLYNIFNWTTYPNSRLIVISISNPLDLPDRLNHKVISRIGNNRLVFKPYYFDQLKKIFEKKIENYELFQEDALNICCKKVASLNGDLRRVFQLCKKAIDIFHKRKDISKLKIDSRMILEAWNKLFDSKLVQTIFELKFYEKLIVFILLYELKSNKTGKCKVSKLFDKHKYFLTEFINVSQLDYSELSFDEFRTICFNLIRLCVIDYTDNNSNFLDSTVTTKIYLDEFSLAMSKCGDESWNKLSDLHLKTEEDN